MQQHFYSMKNKMPSKLHQPLPTHLKIRSLHRRENRHWAPLNPSQPHQSWPASVTLMFFWMSIKKPNKNEQIFLLHLHGTGKSFVSAGLSLWMHLPKHRGHWSQEVLAVPQEPPALPRDGGWDGFSADMVPLCAHGQDTCLAPTCSSLGLKTTLFLQHRRDWSCGMERCRGAMQLSGQDPPNQQLQNEKNRLSC